MQRERGVKMRPSPHHVGLWNQAGEPHSKCSYSEPYTKGNRKPINVFKKGSHETQLAFGNNCSGFSRVIGLEESTVLRLFGCCVQCSSRDADGEELMNLRDVVHVESTGTFSRLRIQASSIIHLKFSHKIGGTCKEN